MRKSIFLKIYKVPQGSKMKQYLSYRRQKSISNMEGYKHDKQARHKAFSVHAILKLEV